MAELFVYQSCKFSRCWIPPYYMERYINIELKETLDLCIFDKSIYEIVYIVKIGEWLKWHALL